MPFSKNAKIIFYSLAAGVAIIAAGFFLTRDYFAKTPAATEETTTGISLGEILIGSASALSGHAGFLGSEYLRGAQAFLEKTNDEGGIYGRKIKLAVYDDQYDPAKTVFYTQKLINEDKVFALFNYVGTPTGIKIVPLVEEAKVPLLGLFTGADVFRNPFRQNIFNVRASYYQEVAAFIKIAVEEMGVERVAVFYQYDAYGLDGLKGAEIALAKYGLKPVATASYQRGTLGVESGLETIKESQAEAIVMVGTYSPMAKFIKLARAEKFNPIFHNVSFVGSEALAKELGKDGDGVIVTEVVPPPIKESSFEGVREYTELLEKYFPGAEPSFGGLEGFINAKVLVEALKKAGPKLSRESFIESLEKIQNYSAGIGPDISFGPAKHQGMDKIYLVRIKDGKFHLFESFSQIKNEETTGI